MPQTVVVRYTTRPQATDENARLIAAVFAQLAEQKPAGLGYVCFRDGHDFVHVAVLDAKDNPLLSLPAFIEFSSTVNERCSVPPSPEGTTVVGSYLSV